MVTHSQCVVSNRSAINVLTSNADILAYEASTKNVDLLAAVSSYSRQLIVDSPITRSHRHGQE